MALLKKILIVLLLLFAGLISGLYVVSLKYEKIVSGVIVSQLNELLTAEIKVGDISVSPWAELPFVSLKFNQVFIADPFFKSDTLLQAENIYFHFNALDLFREDYRIKNIEVDHGAIYIKRNAKAEYNYSIWKSTQDTNASIFELSAVKINDCKIRYTDPGNETKLRYLAESLILKFSSTQEELLLDVYGKAFSINTAFGQTDFLPNKSLKLDIGMRILSEKQSQFNFHRAALQIDNQLSFDIKGNISEKAIHLNLSASKVDLEALSSLIPFRFVNDLKKYKPKGTASLDLLLSEADLSTRKPKVELTSLVSSASLELPDSKKRIAIDHLKAIFTNGEGRSAEASKLTIESGRLKSGKSSMDFNLALLNFNAPEIRLSAEAVVELNEWLKADEADFEMNEGRFEGKFMLRFNYKDSLSAADFAMKHNLLDGTIQGLDMRYQGNHYALEEANLSLQKGHLLLSDAYLSINKEALHLEVLGQNFIELFKDNASIVAYSGELNGESLNLDRFFEGLSGSEGALQLPNINLDFKLGKLRYLESEFSKASGHLLMRGNELKIDKARFEHSGGKLQADINMSFVEDGSELSLFADFQKIDIKALFENFKNFEQEVLTSKNLSGMCSGEVNFSMKLDSNYSFDPASIRAIVSLRVDNGALVDFEPMQAVADYFDSNLLLRKIFKADELRKKLKHIAFESLRNDFFIRDSEVITPLMEIKSSVLDINLEGSYGFDHVVDYHMDFYITDLLTRESKSGDFGEEIVDDGTGRKRIFLRMTGPVDDPEFELDKEKRKAYRKGIVQSEKMSVKEVLKEELKLIASDSSTSASEKANKAEAIEIIWDPEDDGDRSEKQTEAPVKSELPDSSSNSKMKRLLKKLIQEGESNKSTDDFNWDDDDY